VNLLAMILSVAIVGCALTLYVVDLLASFL
jgi:hypothetical protein